MTRRIAVIGGGVVGASVAFHLAERDLGEVVLFERDRLGSGTTWHSAGNITWKPHGGDDAPILYAFDLIDRLDREGRQATGWRTTGRLFLGLTEEGLDGFRDFHTAAGARGIDSRWLTPGEAASRHPLLAADAIAGAWLNPLSGHLNPADFTASLARAARDRGAGIVEMKRIDRIGEKAGVVDGLWCEETFHAFDEVVVTAGLWSRGLILPLGFPAAQWGCEHFYLIARPGQRLPRETPSFVCPEALIYGREEVGGLLFGLFDEAAKPCDPDDLPDPFAFSLMQEDWDKVAPYVEVATRLFPALEVAPISSFINGPESFTPDGDPLIGAVPGMKGLYICSGMNSLGVTLAAAAGHTVADLIAETAPRFSVDRYGPARFGDRGGDKAWLANAVSDTPSRSYREANSRT